jgi:hypothetical protein
MTKPQHDEDAPRLFWSNSGEIACARHAPPSGGPRWLEERWKPLRAVAAAGIDYRCQQCRREAVDPHDDR